MKRFTLPEAILRVEPLEDRLLLAGILGTAQDFAVLGHTTVTNTGPSVIFGDASTLANVGVFIAGGANATTGFSSAGNTFVGPGSNTDGPGLVVAPAAIHLGDPVADLARNDLITAYTALASYGTATDLTGQVLGNGVGGTVTTLVAGVYSFASTAQLNGLLQLDAQGTNGGVWVFQIGTDLTTASASSVRLINPGGNLGSDVGVFWVLGTGGTAGLGSATLGTDTAFEGNILALTSITLNTRATIYNGRALAIEGAVTLDTNTISDICPPASSAPNSGPGFSLGGLGSIAWEKRDAGGALLGGAQFTISPDPIDGVGLLTILDNGPGDADPALGQILVINALLDTYTITETVAPLGYVIDADPTRVVSVTVGDLTPVIGVPGNDALDFHNSLSPVSVGSIAWEKRDAGGALLGGAQFMISPDPTDGVGILTILDNGPGDADPAVGQILVNNVLLGGPYTITETAAPLGYVIDVAPRSVTVTVGNLTQVIGVPGNDSLDFHDSLSPVSVGSIAWEKRDVVGALLAGATFTIDLDPTIGVNILTILDNGPNDADPAVGQFLVNNVLLGMYTITETVAPNGYALDVDSTRTVTVALGDLTQVIGMQGTNDPGVTDESDFHNRRHNVIVIGMGKMPYTPQIVQVIDEDSGAVLSQFTPYGNTFQGGIRVATGDLNGDGVDEIVTAPGWSIVASIRVYTQAGVLLTSFQPYGSSFNGGVQVAVGDVDGDGLSDIITVPNWGSAEVKVFRNELVLVGGVPKFNGSAPYRDFLAFPSSFIGGAVVAVADMGKLVGSSFDNTMLDGKAEIVIGSNAGMKATVKVFDVSGATAKVAGSFNPFNTASTFFRGGVSLSVARINADLIPDIVVGAGSNGGSLVDVWAWNNTAAATLSSLSANGVGFAAFTDASQTAPVEVTTLDTNGDKIADAILAVQGPGGTTGQIRQFNITSTSPLTVSLPTVVAGSFLGPYFIASIKNPSAALPLVGKLPTKFYVVNDAATNQTFEYDSNGSSVENYALKSGNSAPRGAVSTTVGDKVWVVDANRKVYVYNTSGNLLGSWTAGTLASNATVEGIANNGTDVWIVDAKSDKVFKYANAAGRLSGSQSAASNFNLDSGNTDPKDIVTDGTNFYVVNDAAADKVFKYTLAGSLVGSWTITGGGGAPTGITLNPAAPSHLWIVDNNTDRIEQYDNAVSRISDSQTASIYFALAFGNTNPQGIADPPPSRDTANAATHGAALMSLMEELDWLTPAQRKRRR